jgi:SPP1 gp7 family putative phage head morphogenesis protein
VAATWAVVGFASDGTPLDKLLRDRSKATVTNVSQTLVNGIALGHSPLEVAKNLDSQLNQMHWQNLRLARTEMMRAYREAQRVNMLQNADVLSGWRWSSAADRRTCPICLGQHGKVFPIKHVASGDVPPDTAQHAGLAGTFAAAPAEKVTVG